MVLKNNPLVTAVIPTHNRCTLVQRAIESVLKQTYKNIELIIVDDGSTDNTELVVKTYLDLYPNIRYLKNKTAQGACAARNYGIKEARGLFIANLDDDDEWVPQRIEKMFKAYNEKYAFICTDALVITKNINYRRKVKKIITFDDILYKNYVGNQILARKDIILEAGGFDINLKARQDYDLWIRLLAIKPIAYGIRQPLQINHIEHESERISSHRRTFANAYYLYKKHKHLMHKNHKKFHIFLLNKYKRYNVQFFTIFQYVPPFLWLETVQGYIIRLLKSWLKRMFNE